MDGNTLGLFWEAYEDAWRCATCGHRSFRKRKKSPAELHDDILWDQVLETFEQEQEEKQGHPDEDAEDHEEKLLEAVYEEEAARKGRLRASGLFKGLAGNRKSGQGRRKPDKTHRQQDSVVDLILAGPQLHGL